MYRLRSLALSTAGAAIVAGLLTLPASASANQVAQTSRWSSPPRSLAAPQSIRAAAQAKKGSISGLITARGKPLAKICVLAVGFGQNAERVAVSSKSGRYRIGHLPADSYEVAFVTAGASKCPDTRNWLLQWYPHLTAPGPTKLHKVKVRAGEDTPGINASLLQGGQISGTIQSPAGKGLKGVCVSDTGSSRRYGNLFSEAISRKGGTYVVHSAFPGSYTVQFNPGCHGRDDLAAQWWPHANTAAHAKKIALTSRQHLTGIAARLRSAGIATGTVRAKITHAPIARVCVVARGESGQPEAAVATTGKDGRYKLTGLSTGSYLLQFNPACTNQHGAGFLRGALSLQAVTSRTAHGVDIELARFSGLSGTVTDAHGRPLSGVCVTLRGGRQKRAVTKPDGTYTLGNVRPGGHVVSFAGGCGNKVSLAPQFYDNEPDAAAATKAGSLSGTVTGSGQPHAGRVCVAATSDSLRRDPGAALVSVQTAVTGADGQYTISNLSPGVYKVYFNNAYCDFGPDATQQFAPQWFSDKLTEATATGVTITAHRDTKGVDAALQPFGAVTGTVSTTASGPVTGECVTAVPQDADPDPVAGIPQPSETAISGRTGRYSLLGLPSGQYKVEFSVGCGATGLATQWWNGAGSAASATVVTVKPGVTLAGIDASPRH